MPAILGRSTATVLLTSRGEKRPSWKLVEGLTRFTLAQAILRALRRCTGRRRAILDGSDVALRFRLGFVTDSVMGSVDMARGFLFLSIGPTETTFVEIQWSKPLIDLSFNGLLWFNMQPVKDRFYFDFEYCMQIDKCPLCLHLRCRDLDAAQDAILCKVCNTPGCRAVLGFELHGAVPSVWTVSGFLGEEEACLARM